MSVLLNVPDFGELLRIFIEIYVVIYGLLFGRIIHRVLRNQQMTIETVNFILHCFLETAHDQKRNYYSGQSYSHDHDRDVVNRRGKSLLLITTDSFGYEIRKVQGLVLTFSDIDSVQNRITIVHNQQCADSKFVFIDKGKCRDWLYFSSF